MSRPPLPSPRFPQPYSPRRPSPLGSHPPLAPHMAFYSPTLGPSTPGGYIVPKGSTETQVRLLPEAHRRSAPLAGSGTTQQHQHQQQRRPTPLNLTSDFHPTQLQNYRSQLRSTTHDRKRPVKELSPTLESPPALVSGSQRNMKRRSLRMQPEPTQDMKVAPSPTLSSTSSLSLYSADGSHGAFPVDVVQHGQQQATETSGHTFCACLNLRSWFGGSSKSKAAREAKILGPPATSPQMAQTRRRPPPITVPE